MAADSSKGQKQQLQKARADPGEENSDPKEVANTYQGLSGLRGSPFLGKFCWFHTWAVTQAPDSIPVLSLTQRVAPGSCWPHREEEAAQGLPQHQCPQPVWGPHPVPPPTRQEHPGSCTDPQPCSFSLTGSPSCMRHPDALGMGTAAHTLHTAGTFPAALPGRAGEEEMGMAWQVHTSSALSQISPAPSHPAHHMPAHTHPPRPPRAPGQTHSRRGGKKSSKRLTVFQPHHKTFLTF